MKMSAFDLNQNRIMVEVDPSAPVHIVCDGKEIGNDIRTVAPHFRKAVETVTDDLFDLPIYEDGIIHTGKTKAVYAWMEAVKA